MESHQQSIQKVPKLFKMVGIHGGYSQHFCFLYYFLHACQVQSTICLEVYMKLLLSSLVISKYGESSKSTTCHTRATTTTIAMNIITTDVTM